eukprot:5111575-Amphidinium_carterae.1
MACLVLPAAPAGHAFGCSVRSIVNGTAAAAGNAVKWSKVAELSGCRNSVGWSIHRFAVLVEFLRSE